MEYYINVYKNDCWEVQPYATLQQAVLTKEEALDDAIAHGSDYAFTIKVNPGSGESVYMNLTEKADRGREEIEQDVEDDEAHIYSESLTSIYL